MLNQDPLWSALATLKVLGRAQGFLTYRQVSDHLPPEIVDPEKIEGIVDDLQRAGIRVLEDYPGVANQTQLSQPSPAARRASQVCVLGSAEPGSIAYELAGAAGDLLARSGITLVSGCGSPATRFAAERALAAGGLVVSIVPSDDIALPDWPCSVLIPCGMGAARNLLMALAGDACLVIGGRAGTISEVCLAWLHHRPLLPLAGCGGWSDRLEQNPPDERGNSKILAWSSIQELASRLTELGLRVSRSSPSDA